MQNDRDLYERALGILYRMSLERTGWRGFFQRWHHSDEPLRNDAANLCREAGYHEIRPIGTRPVGGGDAE